MITQGREIEMKQTDLPDILTKLSFDDIIQIDVALEGNWNPTVKTVWSREGGFIGFSDIVVSHPRFKPSLELYYPRHWIGIHCYKRIDDINIFDESLAQRIIRYVHEKIK